ncbi:MAG: EscU/YscU/HrcU family type III secretion system export apparatus switch protein [Chlamydiales bacterium]
MLILLFAFSFALLVLGICDYFYQRWLFLQEMRMTAEEKNEERREDHCEKG